jgi:uncharacterized Zn-binding protein involved in type VI secretion
MQEPKAKTLYEFVTIGSPTRNGGHVTTATASLTVAGLSLARVGDVVTYSDGSEAVIEDGAGFLVTSEGKSFALVGSHLSNGDCIVETLRKGRGVEVPDGTAIEGLFDASYTPPPEPPRYRVAVRGATTRRGGVLRDASGEWKLDDRIGKAAVVGDMVHYADGSSARIVSGLELNADHDFQPVAYVGSVLDNGDIITDSPDRKGYASSTSFKPTRTEVTA